LGAICKHANKFLRIELARTTCFEKCFIRKVVIFATLQLLGYGKRTYLYLR